jgi:ABC-type bacteriocin/lantibiotic exporter with double-glycine peptidase domain
MIFVPVFLGLVIYIAGPLGCCAVRRADGFYNRLACAGSEITRSALKERDETDDERYNFLIEGLDGVHTIKAFALENNFARRYEKLEETSTLSNYQCYKSNVWDLSIPARFSRISWLPAVIVSGALFALHGHITTGAH